MKLEELKEGVGSLEDKILSVLKPGKFSFFMGIQEKTGIDISDLQKELDRLKKEGKVERTANKFGGDGMGMWGLPEKKDLKETGIQAHPDSIENKVLDAYQDRKISYEQAAEQLKKHITDTGELELAMDALDVMYGDIEAEFDEDA